MEICIIGTGYVGLVTGTVFAELGWRVVCVDTDDGKIERLRRGEMPIYEPGLAEMATRNMSQGRLRFTARLSEAMESADIAFICVGTPPLSNGDADLSQVEAAARAIAKCLNQYTVVVTKSTVPVGTGALVESMLERRPRGVGFDVVSNPEFLREGSAIHDALHPDRVIIGAPTAEVAQRIAMLYAPLNCPVLMMDVPSAEMTKYACNAFLATKISFVNAVANLCEASGADVSQVAEGMGLDRRIGRHFLNAGLGYGGSCFPKDTEAMIRMAQQHGYDFTLLKAAVDVNRRQAQRFVLRLSATLGGLEGRRVGVLGLAFKPNTDDVRDSKAADILRSLLSAGARVSAYDPVAIENMRRLLPGVTYCQNACAVAEDADALLLVTEWEEFQRLDLTEVRRLMRRPLIFDGRNALNPEQTRAMGFEYLSIGRGRETRGVSSREAHSNSRPSKRGVRERRWWREAVPGDAADPAVA